MQQNAVDGLMEHVVGKREPHGDGTLPRRLVGEDRGR
jgi:hypothetical protein